MFTSNVENIHWDTKWQTVLPSGKWDIVDREAIGVLKKIEGGKGPIVAW